jgi:hypothetical protein
MRANWNTDDTGFSGFTLIFVVFAWILSIHSKKIRADSLKSVSSVFQFARVSKIQFKKNRRINTKLITAI